MISQAQLIANQQNAQHSTGPNTEEGKSRSAQNALKHGLTAQTPALLPTENESAYLTFRDELLADLRPRSPLQRTLAERLVQLAWRLRRLVSVQSAPARPSKVTAPASSQQRRR